jgi:hypothetical protein
MRGNTEDHPRVWLEANAPKADQSDDDSGASVSGSTRPSDALPTFVPHDVGQWPRDWKKQAWFTGTFLTPDDSTSEVESEYLRYLVMHSRSAVAGTITILIIVVLAFAVIIAVPAARDNLIQMGSTILVTALCTIGCISVLIAEYCMKLEGRSAHEQRQSSLVIERCRMLLHGAIDISAYFSGLKSAAVSTYSLNSSTLFIILLMSYFLHVRFSRSAFTLFVYPIANIAGVLTLKAATWPSSIAAMYGIANVILLIPFMAIAKIVDMRNRSRFVAIVHSHFERTRFNRNEVTMSRIMQTVVPPALLPRLTDAESIKYAWYLDNSPNCVVAIASVPAMSSWASSMVPMDAVRAIHAVFSRFDGILSEYEQTRNIKRAVVNGDKFVVCGGLVGGMLKARRTRRVRTKASEVDQLVNQSDFTVGTYEWKRELLRDMIALGRELVNVAAEVERDRQAFIRDMLSNSRAAFGNARSQGDMNNMSVNRNVNEYSLKSSFAAMGPESYFHMVGQHSPANYNATQQLRLCVGLGAGRCLGGIHGEETQFRYVLYGQALSDATKTQLLGDAEDDSLIVSRDALQTVTLPSAADESSTEPNNKNQENIITRSGEQQQPSPQVYNASGGYDEAARSATSTTFSITSRTLDTLAYDLLPSSLQFVPVPPATIHTAPAFLVTVAEKLRTPNSTGLKAPPPTTVKPSKAAKAAAASGGDAKGRSVQLPSEQEERLQKSESRVKQLREGESDNTAEEPDPQSDQEDNHAMAGVPGTTGEAAGSHRGSRRSRKSRPSTTDDRDDDSDRFVTRGVRVTVKHVSSGGLATRADDDEDDEYPRSGGHRFYPAPMLDDSGIRDTSFADHTLKSANAVMSMTRSMHHPAEFVSRLIANLSTSVSLHKYWGVFDSAKIEGAFRGYACIMDAPVGGVMWIAVWTSGFCAVLVALAIIADPHFYPPGTKFTPAEDEQGPSWGIALFALSAVIFATTSIVTNRYVSKRAEAYARAKLEREEAREQNSPMYLLNRGRDRDRTNLFTLPPAFYVIHTLAMSLGFGIGTIANVVTGPFTIVTTNRVGVVMNYLAAILILSRWQPWWLKLALMVGVIGLPASLCVVLMPRDPYGVLNEANAYQTIWLFIAFHVPFIYFIGLDTRVEYAVLRVCEHVREASKERAELTRKLSRGLVPEHLIDEVIQRFHDADELETEGGLANPGFNPPPPLVVLRRPLKFYSQQQHGSFWQRCAVQPAQKMMATFGELCVTAMQFEPFEADSGRALLRLRGGVGEGGNFDNAITTLLPSAAPWGRSPTEHSLMDSRNSRPSVLTNPLAGSSEHTTSSSQQAGPETVPADAEAVLSVLDELDAAIASVGNAYLRVVSVLGDQLMIAGPIGEPKTLDEDEGTSDSDRLRSKKDSNSTTKKSDEQERLEDNDFDRAAADINPNLPGDPEAKKKEQRRVREVFVMRAAVGMVEVLRQISHRGGRTFTAAMSVDSAIGAVIGDVTTSMRYSVFGVAPRNAQRLLQAAPPLLGGDHRSGPPVRRTSVALALECFRRLHDRKLIARATDAILDRIAPDFRVASAPINALMPTTFDSTVFNPPMRWRLSALGQICVYSIKLTSDSLAGSFATSSSADDLHRGSSSAWEAMAEDSGIEARFKASPSARDSSPPGRRRRQGGPRYSGSGEYDSAPVEPPQSAVVPPMTAMFEADVDD